MIRMTNRPAWAALSVAEALAACGGATRPQERAQPLGQAEAMTVGRARCCPARRSGCRAATRASRCAPRRGLHGKLEIWINGSRTTQTLASHGDRLEGV
jgi:hypothetical protein